MIPIPLSPRLILYAIGTVLAALAFGWVLISFDPFNRRQRAEMKAANATAQAQASDTVAKALDTHTVQVHVIKERESRAVQTVQSAPGASDLIPDSLRDAWLSGLSDIEAGPAGDNRPGEPAGAMPAT